MSKMKRFPFVMKKQTLILLLTVVFFLLPINTLFSEELSGFLGIQWGQSKDFVDSSLKEKLFYPVLAQREYPSYQGVFAGEKAEISLLFYEDQFCGAIVSFLTKEKYNDSIEKMLEKKYGQFSYTPKTSGLASRYENWDRFYKSWSFEPGEIILIYLKYSYTIIWYLDGALSENLFEAERAQKATEKSALDAAMFIDL